MGLDVLVTIVSIVFILIISIFGSKLYLNNKIKKLVPLGVEFADKLSQNTNREKLTKAISFIELSILNIMPLPVKPFVDYLIDSDKIATGIERFITKRKIKELNNLENKNR